MLIETTVSSSWFVAYSTSCFDTILGDTALICVAVERNRLAAVWKHGWCAERQRRGNKFNVCICLEPKNKCFTYCTFYQDSDEANIWMFLNDAVNLSTERRIDDKLRF